MKLPRLKGSKESGEGEVIFPADWKNHDALLRADLLRDWYRGIADAYNEAVAELEDSIGLPPSDPNVRRH